MKLKKNIAVSESGFIFNPATGDSFAANPVGLRILELMKSGRSYKDIIKQLVNEYEVTREQLEQDLDDYSALLRQLYLTDDD